MRKKEQKNRCEKRVIPKCQEICKTYDKVQYACADYLSGLEEVTQIRCNVWLEGLGLDKDYTSDFVCTKENGDLMVRECVFRRMLTKPLTAKLLEASRRYWERHGVMDWGLVIDEK